jgi:PAS domain S-box-containing protein
MSEETGEGAWPGNAKPVYRDGKPRVLFVEDETAIREHLAESLSDEFIVDAAADGEQALRAVLQNRPDLVATDLLMPGLDGVELVKTLRDTPSTATIPILMISGRAPEELRLAGFELGADSYLPKPYQERELRVRIRSMLESARVRLHEANRAARERAEQRVLAERVALLESITDAFYGLDTQWRFTYVNQRALDYYGKRREELLGRVIWDVFPVARNSSIRAEYERAVREQIAVHLETISPLTERWVEVHAYPTPFGLAVNFRDISERKQAEAALRESALRLRQSEERYRAFVANSTEGIWRFELDAPLDLSSPPERQLDHIYRHARLEELNDAMARMYGYQHSRELVGAPIGQMLPASDDGALAYLRQLIAARFQLSGVESIARDRSGGLRHFENSIVPVIENGRLLRAWGMQRDITDRKRTEELLKESERRKDEFLAVLAHELRNPLAPIRTGLHLMRLRAAKEPAVERIIEMMDRQMTHMVRLVDDLLDISRISRGKLELRRENVALDDVVANAVEATHPLMSEHGHELHIEVRVPGLYVYGDPNRLAQVLANLLSNGAKYTERGGRIALTLTRDGDQALITVSDTGVGIPEQALERVFEMFSQVGAHQSRSDGGLGIGLALVRTLVEMHGGSVTAHSKGVGKGSMFEVRLPLVQAEAAAQAAAAPHGDVHLRPHAARRRVLVADDNADAALSLSMLLDALGYEVRTASDGVEAVAMTSRYAPHLIFMDLGMPNMDGLEAARRIRTLTGGRDILIAALTGWGQQGDRERTQAAGIDLHLVKPVSSQELENVLHLLEERAAGP